MSRIQKGLPRRRKEDNPEKDFSRPPLLEETRSIIRSDGPVSFLRFGRLFVPAPQRLSALLQKTLYKESLVTASLIRLVSLKTATGLPAVYNYYVGSLSNPQTFVAYLQSGDSGYRGYMRIDKKGNRFVMAPHYDPPDLDQLHKMAIGKNRVYYVKGKTVYSVDRKDPHATVHMEQGDFPGNLQRIVIPVNGYGLIELSGKDLSFGNWIARDVSTVVTSADFSNLHNNPMHFMVK